MRYLFAFLASLFIANPAFAVEDNEQGAFLGVFTGVSSFDDDGEFDDFRSADDSDSVFKVTGGYRFNPYVAIEAAVANLGTFSGTGFNAFSDLKVESEYSTFYIAAVGTIPLANSGVALYGRGGIAVIRREISVNNGSFSDSDDSTGGGLIFGGGIRWTPPGADFLAFDFGVDAYIYGLDANGDDEFDEDEDFTQTITTTQVGVQFAF